MPCRNGWVSQLTPARGGNGFIGAYTKLLQTSVQIVPVVSPCDFKRFSDCFDAQDTGWTVLLVRRDRHDKERGGLAFLYHTHLLYQHFVIELFVVVRNLWSLVCVAIVRVGDYVGVRKSLFWKQWHFDSDHRVRWPSWQATPVVGALMPSNSLYRAVRKFMRKAVICSDPSSKLLYCVVYG